MSRALSIIIAFAITPVLAQSDVGMDDVPEAARETAIATAPGVTFTKVTAEVENGRTVYEFEGRSPDGKHIEVDVLENGTLDEIEMEMAFDELPQPVKSAIASRYPGFKATYVESSVRSNGEFLYEVEGSSADGASLVIEVAEDGEVRSAGADAES
jgi:uncharacterized membrane protein YkoI